MLNDRGVETKVTPGGKGQFDVVLDGEVLFSKHETQRFPGESEIASLVGA